MAQRVVEGAMTARTAPRRLSRRSPRATGAVSERGCISVSWFGFRGHRPRPAGAGGSKPAVRQAGLFVPVSGPYLTALPT